VCNPGRRDKGSSLQPRVDPPPPPPPPPPGLHNEIKNDPTEPAWQRACAAVQRVSTMLRATQGRSREEDQEPYSETRMKRHASARRDEPLRYIVGGSRAPQWQAKRQAQVPRGVSATCRQNANRSAPRVRARQTVQQCSNEVWQAWRDCRDETSNLPRPTSPLYLNLSRIRKNLYWEWLKSRRKVML